MSEEYIEILTEIEEETFTCPERVLFLSVIFQALLDATKEKTIVESSRTSVERQHARAWFFCSVGVTCDNFEQICDHAGMSPTYTRSFAYKVIHSPDIKYVRQRIKKML